MKIKQAILFKQEIENNMHELFYSQEMFYVSGSNYNFVPEIKERESYGVDSVFQYAVTSADDTGEKVVGYIQFSVDWYSKCAYNWAVVSFDRGNTAIAKALLELLNRCFDEYALHRIEWKMIGGNPVERGYDNALNYFKKKGFLTSKHVFKDSLKDKSGKYRDSIIFEIIKGV